MRGAHLLWVSLIRRRAFVLLQDMLGGPVDRLVVDLTTLRQFDTEAVSTSVEWGTS